MEQIDGPGVGRAGIIIPRADQNAVVTQWRHRRAEVIPCGGRGIVEGAEQDGTLRERNQRCVPGDGIGTAFVPGRTVFFPNDRPAVRQDTLEARPTQT